MNGTGNNPPMNGTGNNPPPMNGTGNNPPMNGTGNNPPMNGTVNNPPPMNGTGNNPPPMNGTGNNPSNNGTTLPGNGTQGNFSVRFSTITNNFTNLTWNALDSSMNNAVFGSSIWRLNKTANIFTKYYDSPIPYLANPQIYTIPGIIVITSYNQTSAQVFAYTDDNSGHLHTALKYQFDKFVNTPKIMVSPKFSKVFVVGPANTPPSSN
jgi:hypothetical protein